MSSPFKNEIIVTSNSDVKSDLNTPVMKENTNTKTTFGNMKTAILGSISSVKNINPEGFSLWKVGLIIIILAFLGLNLFTYLGDATDKTTNVVTPVFQNITTFIGNIIKQVTNISALGTKTGVDIGAGSINSGINLLQGNIENSEEKQTRNQIDSNTEEEPSVQSPSVQSPSVQSPSVQSPSVQAPTSQVNSNNTDSESDLDKLLHKASMNQNVPEPDDAGSRTQHTNSKSGYCYIGEDRGFRSCVKVNESDECMSGDIFPSNEICVNPNLRE